MKVMKQGWSAILPALCAGCLLAFVPRAAAEMTPEEALREAASLEKRGSFEKAIAIYDDFLAKQPKHIQATTVRYQRALCFDNLGQPDKAMAAFREVMAEGPSRHFKHRAECAIKLAKLQGEGKKYEDGVKTLTTLLKEGAGLYEDEAQNLCAGYNALLGNYNEAAVMFNVLRNKSESALAKEAAYKLAIVWLKEGNTEMARHAVDYFAQKYPTHPKTVELFIRVARHYFDNEKYKSALSVCEQVRSQYQNRPEALEAAFIVALCFRESGKPEAAIKSFEDLAKMPQSAHNMLLASEALFEIGQIYRKELNDQEKATEYYARAAAKSRDPLTERHRQILEHSLFYQAEHYFQKEKWSSALDLYMQMREAGTKLNVLGRILHCQSKMDKYGEAGLSGDSDEDRKFLQQRIDANPGTTIALQSEVFLVDMDLEKAMSRGHDGGLPGGTIQSLADRYGKILTKYPDRVLKEGDMGSYVRMRMGYVYSLASEEDNRTNARELWRKGLELYEKALEEAPDSLFRVEALEGVAVTAQMLGINHKAFRAYQKLYEVTGQEKYTKDPKDAAAARREKSHEPHEYIRGLASTATTADMALEAIATVRKVLENAPKDSPEAREALFYLAELYYMRKQYSDAAREYKAFVKNYGPPQEADGSVARGYKPPKTIDPELDKVYEAGLRLAHCWYSQGHKVNMLKAYEWLVKNQSHDGKNPRLAEANYVIVNDMDSDDTKPTKESQLKQAEAFWKRIVNPSMDFGSQEFGRSNHPWLRTDRAVPFVKNAILKSAELHSAVGRHAIAANMYRRYLEIYSPDITRRRSKKPQFPRDDLYEAASYSLGMELAQTGDYDGMTEHYRQYIDDHRNVRFRPSILMLLGHYGTQAELFEDAREAYAALLDEYGPPNPKDRFNQPVPVPKTERLRPKSNWNGVRMTPPSKLDMGKVRYSLGYLYWKKEDWELCKRTLTPFVEDAALKNSPSRAESLYMLGRAHYTLKEFAEGAKVLYTLLTDHRRFKAGEEAYVDLTRGYRELEQWKAVDQCYTAFLTRYPNSMRRPYMDLYAALATVGQGQSTEGMRKLSSLAKSDTYEDVKGDAYYHLAAQLMKAPAPNLDLVAKTLEKSVNYYPRAESLLLAGQCAVKREQWAEARTYLDRCVREFPGSEPAVRNEAKKQLLIVSQAEAGR